MLVTEAEGRDVVDTGSASVLGRISDVVIDPRGGSILALRLDRTRDGDTVHWPDVDSFGPDAVTIASRTAVRPAEGRAAELLAADHKLIGKRALTDAGDGAGRVIDVDFDPATGAVTAVITTDGSVSGDRLIGCGSYAVVVHRA